MKAIVVREFGGPEMMRLEEVLDLAPGPGQVLVRVKAAGVNPVDTYIRTGTYTRRPSLPYTPGGDAAGLVEAVGEGVTRLRTGARVYTASSLTGTYAEQVVCLDVQVHPLPERITFAQGAGIAIPYATAYRALFHRARAVAGETVLVHGASGGVGLAALQIARSSGLTVLGTVGTDRGRELVLREGAHEVFDHTRDDHLDAVVAATGGRGADIILEMLANANLGRDLKAIARYGRIVVIGSRGTVQIDPRDAMARDAAILGMVLSNTPDHELASIHRALAAGLENGTLRPITGRELPLVEAPAAHRLVMDSGAYGKIVLVP
jgi:NADPH2:quinone reductase